MSKKTIISQKVITVSQQLPIKQNGRSAGFNLKSSIMEIIDNSIDAANNSIRIEIDTTNNTTTILHDEKGLSEKELSDLVSVGKSGDYGDDNIGNYGLGAFYALTYLGEAGDVKIETVKNKIRMTSELNFRKDNPKPMSYNFNVMDDPRKDRLDIICKTTVPSIFDSVSTLANDLGAHYHDILNDKQKSIWLKIDNSNYKEITPIDPFYRESEKTITWPGNGIVKLPIIENSEVEVDFQGYYISRNTDKNELDKKGKKGFPHEYQGIYINLNGRILKLGNGWGVEGTNNKWVGGRMEIKVNTKSLSQKDKERVLEFFGITSNKNNPSLEISENSVDKKELREIIKGFRSWTDKEYDRFNKERKKEVVIVSKETKSETNIDLSQLKITNFDLENVKEKGMLETMFPDIIEAIKEYQTYAKEMLDI